MTKRFSSQEDIIVPFTILTALITKSQIGDDTNSSKKYINVL
jgi:hypothetical protein